MSPQRSTSLVDDELWRRSINVRIIALVLAAVAFILCGLLFLQQANRIVIAITFLAAVNFSITAILARSLRPCYTSGLLMLTSQMAAIVVAFAAHELSIAPFFCLVGILIASATMEQRGTAITFFITLMTIVGIGIFIPNERTALLNNGSVVSATLLAIIMALVATLNSTTLEHMMARLAQREEQRQRTEDALRESEHYYELIADHTRDIVALLDGNARFLYTSPSFTWQLGYATVTLIGSQSNDLLVEEDTPIWNHLWGQALTYGTAQGRLRATHADRSTCWIEIAFNRVFDQEEIVMLMNARDITAQRDLELQLFKAQKMEAIGRLAGGIAHDFNNLLLIISSSAELATLDIGSTEPAYADIQAIIEASQRGTALTRQLLAFARRQVVAPQLLRLGDLIRNSANIMQRLAGKAVQIQLNIDANLWLVRADPSQLEQVIINLVANARDAMPNGGYITITADNIPDGSECVEAGRRPAGPCVRLVVSDTGMGMGDEVLQHLFEPFFTTKPPGEGTGLGLATCYGIISQNGGSIGVHSSVGGGAIFTILLPRTTLTGNPTTPSDVQEHNVGSAW